MFRLREVAAEFSPEPKAVGRLAGDLRQMLFPTEADRSSREHTSIRGDIQTLLWDKQCIQCGNRPSE